MLNRIIQKLLQVRDHLATGKVARAALGLDQPGLSPVDDISGRVWSRDPDNVEAQMEKLMREPRPQLVSHDLFIKPGTYSVGASGPQLPYSVALFPSGGNWAGLGAPEPCEPVLLRGQPVLLGRDGLYSPVECTGHGTMQPIDLMRRCRGAEGYSAGVERDRLEGLYRDTVPGVNLNLRPDEDPPHNRRQAVDDAAARASAYGVTNWRSKNWDEPLPACSHGNTDHYLPAMIDGDRTTPGSRIVPKRVFNDPTPLEWPVVDADFAPVNEDGTSSEKAWTPVTVENIRLADGPSLQDVVTAAKSQQDQDGWWLQQHENQVKKDPRAYLVRWHIDVDASSPVEAARIAREIQLDPDNIAFTYSVKLAVDAVKEMIEAQEASDWIEVDLEKEGA